ncbi:hypothetical protein VM1G_07054 [Cytospora mali]|uniref:Uncharacterized protein n=1 Tax=Cytospora mali TaxID=578113 RepID=A0A194W6N9_CYTMA|nr:hypothetical protein VM1G_07054 [Valsa mali]
MYRFLCKVLPLIFHEMLSKQELYIGVTDWATKRDFYSYIHQVHYYLLVQKQNSIRNPTSQARKKLRAEIWAEVEVNVFINFIEAASLSRGAFLQDLAAKRKASSTAQPGVHLQDLQDADPGVLSMKLEPEDSINVGMEAVKMVKQDPGLGGLNMDDLEFKPEPDDSDSIRLSDLPEYNGGGGDDGWLNGLQSEDEDNVPHPSLKGRKHKAARRRARDMAAELRTRNAVDRWYRFVRVKLGRPGGTTFFK